MVSQIGKDMVFTLATASERVKTVHAVTKRYKAKVDKLINELEAVDHTNEAAISSFETQINDLIQAWTERLTMLGVTPKGLWIADFDNGQGYFCWKYPETQITHEHSYSDGYAMRRPIGTAAALPHNVRLFRAK